MHDERDLLGVLRCPQVFKLIFAALITTYLLGAAAAQKAEIQELDKAATQLANLLARVHRQLESFDRVLQMRVGRGVLSNQQAADLLAKRADDLAKGTVSATTQLAEEREEAKLFFDAIERAAATSPKWPTLQPPQYYRALVSVILDRVRKEHEAALSAGKNPAQPLDDAYRAVALTHGWERLAETPFTNPHSRLFAALEASQPPVMPDAVAPAGRLEFGVDRPGQDLSMLELPSAKAADCAAACEKNANCRSFTAAYPESKSGKMRCWLKSGVPVQRSDFRFVSEVKRVAQASRPIGCFRDTNSPFDLDGFLERSKDNTPQRCIATCKAKGFLFAGVQSGESCLCGNSYGRYGTANNCTMTCTGNRNEACGGSYSNIVYATGL
jgi:hypothetical protein